jgi:hypothetical protein
MKINKSIFLITICRCIEILIVEFKRTGKILETFAELFFKTFFKKKESTLYVVI